MIASGGYGCIYRPEITKHGKQTKNEEMVSKIQLNNFSSKNEMEISEILKELKNADDYFGLIENMSGINISKMSSQLKAPCDKLKAHKTEDFILMNIPFIGKYNYREYLLNQGNNKNLFLYMVETYKRLLSGLILLSEKKIIHFDLKDTNILFDETKKLPKIIDFGLSIQIDKVWDNLTKYFYIYAPDYYYWPLEVHYLNFIFHEKSKPNLIEQKIICQSFVEQNNILQDNFSPFFKKNYLKLCEKQLEEYEKDPKEAIKHILNRANTWDNYSLSLLFLKYLKYFNILGFVKNNFMCHFATLLTTNIHPNPLKRYTPQETLDKFEEYFYDVKINNTKNYIEILENLIKTREEMNIAIKKDMRELSRLDRIIKSPSAMKSRSEA